MSDIIPFSRQANPSGFTNTQFKKLDGLFLQANARGVLRHRTVDCDFDDGVATYTYFVSEGQAPYLQFVIRKVGPRTTMYEVYLQGKGRIKKSGVFDLAFEVLDSHISGLLHAD